MPESPSLVGMIEIDADHRSSRFADGTLSELLHSLQTARIWDVETWETDLWPPEELAEEPAFAELDEAWPRVESMHVLQANLPQLQTDLEHELRRLIKRLLAAM